MPLCYYVHSGCLGWQHHYSVIPVKRVENDALEFVINEWPPLKCYGVYFGKATPLKLPHPLFMKLMLQDLNKIKDKYSTGSSFLFSWDLVYSTIDVEYLYLRGIAKVSIKTYLRN